MAINVALPLSGLSDMFEGCCLLSPISPIDVTFRENFKMMVSPDSESSSGVSSFDSADAIKVNQLDFSHIVSTLYHYCLMNRFHILR